MALDAIAEVVLRTAGKFVLEVVVVGIFYWPGWLILRIVTVGRYPPRQSQPHNREFVATIALATLLAALTFAYSGVFA